MECPDRTQQGSQGSCCVRFRNEELMKSAGTLLLVLVGSTALAQDIRIGVFGLFHPSELTVASGSANAVVAHLDQQSLILDSGSGTRRAIIRAKNGAIEIRSGPRLLLTHEVTFTSRKG